jgi:hypothetical protein
VLLGERIDDARAVGDQRLPAFVGSGSASRCGRMVISRRAIVSSAVWSVIPLKVTRPSSRSRVAMPGRSAGSWMSA